MLFDEEAYINESEQSQLQALYHALGRHLTLEEKQEVYIQRLAMMQEYIGESDEEYLYKKMYYE